MSESWRERCQRPGTSILVGSVDAKGFPICCRAIAVRCSNEPKKLTVYVPIATSHDTIANVAATRRLAVTVNQPLTHDAIQIKGTTTAVRLAGDDEHEFVETRLLQFGDVLAEIGLPRKITRSIAHWPAFAIEVKVEQVFEQTPGPKAGSAIP